MKAFPSKERNAFDGLRARFYSARTEMIDDPDRDQDFTFVVEAVSDDWVAETHAILHTPLPPVRDRYYVFSIPKRDGGRRTIKDPIPVVKDAQRRLAAVLERVTGGMPSCAHAYIRRRSIVSMAVPHLKKRTVVKVDIKKFFESLTAPMIERALRAAEVHPLIREAVSALCFDENESLPTGAPTSPILSNIFAREFLDHRIEAMCRYWRAGRQSVERYDRIDYTRYADDLVFSSNYAHLPSMLPALCRKIEAIGLRINGNKVKVLEYRHRQLVCGVVVNEKLSTLRKRRRRLRGTLYSILRDGLSRAVPKGFKRIDRDMLFVEPIDLAKLAGEVEFIRSVNRRQSRYLRLLLLAIRAVHFDEPIHARLVSWFLKRRVTLCSNPTSHTPCSSSTTEKSST